MHTNTKFRVIEYRKENYGWMAGCLFKWMCAHVKMKMNEGMSPAVAKTINKLLNECIKMYQTEPILQTKLRYLLDLSITLPPDYSKSML